MGEFGKMEVDYDFCLNTKLTVNDLLIWLDLDDGLDDGYCGDFFSRNMMVVGDNIRISCLHKDFDRWANSEEMWLDMNKRSNKRIFIEWVKEQRKET